MKKVIVIGVVFLFVVMSFTSISGNQINNQTIKSSGRGNILYVGGSGEGNYSKIQDAIDDAVDGDTVFVYNGTYRENVVIDKSINLYGECKDKTFIRGYMGEYPVSINANWVNFSGFNTKYSSKCVKINSNNSTISKNIFLYFEDKGIEINSDYNTITDNTFQGGWGNGIEINSDYNTITDNNISEFGSNGIYLSDSSSDNSISGNNISASDYGEYSYGIFLDSSNNNTIWRNEFLYNLLGIWLDSSDNNVIEQNNFSGNANCIYLKSSFENTVINNSLIDNAHGIMLSYSNNNTIIGNFQYPGIPCTSFSLSYSNNNIIKNNTIFHGSDISLYKSNRNVIYRNTVSNSWSGIYLSNSSNNTLVLNYLISNYDYGLYCYPGYGEDHTINLLHKNCNHFYHNNKIKTNKKRGDSLYGNDNIIYHNNFITNTQSAYDECNNTWDNGYPSGGNFWDDYDGSDSDGDGIGDTPYLIPGGDNQDRYPLMKPFGENLAPFADFKWIPDLPAPGEKIFFNASDSIDFDGNIILYEWDWDGDGVFNENHTGPNTTHIWENIGEYPVTLRVTDNGSSTGMITKCVLVWMMLNPPHIDGPTSVKVGVEYDYEFVQVNPEDHKISYFIDWGDNTTTGWTEYYNASEEIIRNHTWYEKGVYRIKAKVKNIYGIESDWSVFFVKMPKYRSVINSFILRFLEQFPLLERLLTVLRLYI